MGTSDVRIKTRFVASNECDAPLSFKEKYIHAESRDTMLLKTIVGLPGRMIKNSFTILVNNDKEKRMKQCRNCLIIILTVFVH